MVTEQGSAFSHYQSPWELFGDLPNSISCGYDSVALFCPIRHSKLPLRLSMKSARHFANRFPNRSASTTHSTKTTRTRSSTPPANQSLLYPFQEKRIAASLRAKADAVATAKAANEDFAKKMKERESALSEAGAYTHHEPSLLVCTFTVG